MSPEAAAATTSSDADAASDWAALDAAGVLAVVRSLALERFPRERRTLEIFFEELGRRLTGAPAAADGEGDEANAALPAGSFADLLTRLEELLEALLVGQAHGITPR